MVISCYFLFGGVSCVVFPFCFFLVFSLFCSFLPRAFRACFLAFSARVPLFPPVLLVRFLAGSLGAPLAAAFLPSVCRFRFSRLLALRSFGGVGVLRFRFRFRSAVRFFSRSCVLVLSCGCCPSSVPLRRSRFFRLGFRRGNRPNKYG